VSPAVDLVRLALSHDLIEEGQVGLDGAPRDIGEIVLVERA
jgi:hypothetical protein